MILMNNNFSEQNRICNYNTASENFYYMSLMNRFYGIWSFLDIIHS